MSDLRVIKKLKKIELIKLQKEEGKIKNKTE